MCVSFMTGHFCKKIYYFPLKFLAQFLVTVVFYGDIIVVDFLSVNE